MVYTRIGKEYHFKTLVAALELLTLWNFQKWVPEPLQLNRSKYLFKSYLGESLHLGNRNFQKTEKARVEILKICLINYGKIRQGSRSPRKHEMDMKRFPTQPEGFFQLKESLPAQHIPIPSPTSATPWVHEWSGSMSLGQKYNNQTLRG